MVVHLWLRPIISIGQLSYCSAGHRGSVVPSGSVAALVPGRLSGCVRRTAVGDAAILGAVVGCRATVAATAMTAVAPAAPARAGLTTIIPIGPTYPLALQFKEATLTSLLKEVIETQTSPSFAATDTSCACRLMVASVNAVISPPREIEPVLWSTSATRSRAVPQAVMDETLTVIWSMPTVDMKSQDRRANSASGAYPSPRTVNEPKIATAKCQANGRETGRTRRHSGVQILHREPQVGERRADLVEGGDDLIR